MQESDYIKYNFYTHVLYFKKQVSIYLNIVKIFYMKTDDILLTCKCQQLSFLNFVSLLAVI